MLPRFLALLGLWGLLAGPAAGPAAHPALAQEHTPAPPTYTLLLRGVPLSEALDHLVRTTRIDLVYTTDLIAGKVVYCTRRQAPAEELLRCVLHGTGLDYVRSSSGAYVLLRTLEQPPLRGALAGSVIDGETGEPLPYANVLLADAAAGTTTNEAGLFSIANLLSGPHRVVVSYLGYGTAVDSVWIEPGQAQRLRVALRPQHIVIEPLVVDGLAQQVPSGRLGRGEVDGEALRRPRLAGTPDVALSAGRLPGLSVQQPLADLHIQGSGTGEHLTLLDGTPVRNPVSLGRHLGAFSPLALRRITVHKAGFDAARGSHLAGVIHASHDLDGPHTPGLALSLDPVSLNGRVQHRWSWRDGGRAAILAALRTSVWEVYRDPGVQTLLESWNTLDPVVGSLWLGDPVSQHSLTLYRQTPRVAFSDAHLALRLHLDPFRILTASAYRGRNHLAAEQTALNADDAGGEDQLILTDDAYDWLNWAGHVGFSRLLGPRSIVTLTVRGSRHTSQYAYHALRHAGDDLDDPARRRAIEAALRPTLGTAPGAREHNAISEGALEATLNHSRSPRHHLDTGLRLDFAASAFELGNVFVAPFSYEATSLHLAWYGQGTIGLGEGTVLEPGLRLTWVPTRRSVYAEPRLALRYDRPWRAEGSLALRISGGLYRQFINQFELSSVGATAIVPSVRFWLPVDRALAPPRALHLATEARLAPGPRWALTLEAYAKSQPRLLGLDYPTLLQTHPARRPTPPAVPLPPDAFIHALRGRAYGAGLRLHHAGPRLTPTLTYSFSHAERRYPGRFHEQYRMVPWNEPHRLTLDVDLHPTRTLTLTATWTGIWGRRWGLRQMYYDYLLYSDRIASFTPFYPDNPDRQPLPAAHHLDLGVTFAQTGRLGTVQVRTFVMNALDYANVFDRSLEPTDDGTFRAIDRLMPGRHLAFSLRLER
ncbi:hypothetical protein AWN76_013915 [Rhodothermaceae bacterium RA]|nr:hypothetical protein AWN76_013915 [Rhodothermaceae bacterium RA]